LDKEVTRKKGLGLAIHLEGGAKDSEGLIAKIFFGSRIFTRLRH
jgi:hypothetical protein